jgi:hypothetical protein
MAENEEHQARIASYNSIAADIPGSREKKMMEEELQRVESRTRALD